MRTDNMKLQTMLLAAALLAGVPSAPAAQETLPEEVAREVAGVREEIAREVAEAEEEVRREIGASVTVLTGDHVVEAGEVVEGDLIVHDGNLRVEGEIRGNAVVTDGDLLLVEGATILGDAVVTGGRLLNEGGRVRGEMLTVGGERGAASPPRPPRPPREVELVRTGRSWFDPIGQGIADLFSTLAFGLVLAGIGAGVVFFALPSLRTVSETLRHSPGRSAAVGLATLVVLVPALIVLVVLLAVTIVGILLIPLAVPLYLLAFVGALAFGLVAAAHLIGERTAEQHGGFSYRYRNAYAYVFVGIALLLAPFAASALFEMTGILDWVGTLLAVFGGLALAGVSIWGMGAVILSRAGRQKAFAREHDPVLDDDPLFDSEPIAR